MLYPINLNLDEIEVTVIVGGEIAYRKCKNFITFGIKIKVISINFIDKFKNIESKIEMIHDTYNEEYIKSSFIVVAATNNREINKKIGVYCRENGKLVNVVDDINLSNYTVPAYIKRGDLIISISTGGKSPSLSRKIKDELKEKYDESYEEYINLLGIAREKILKKYDLISERKKLLNSLVNLSLEDLKEYIKYIN